MDEPTDAAADQPLDRPTRCGFVAVIGAPNAGKSTLVNRLVGSKVAIVTPKVQTTRARLNAIAMIGASQIIFVDTPGIFAPKRRLDRAMVSAAWGGVDEADQVLFLVDAPQLARHGDSAIQPIVEKIQSLGRKVLLALNKIDDMPREKLLALAQQLNDAFRFERTFMISALKGSGIDDLSQYLATAMPEGPWHYPEDQLSDSTERLLAAEIVREKAFLRLHDELPYAITVETDKFEERPDGSYRIEMTIYVERDGQKAIVLGQGGRQVKEIGQKARLELSKLFGCPVHLFLFVKVRENWGNDPERYRQMGLQWTS